MGYLAGTAVSDSGDSIRITFNCHALAERTLSIKSANISADGEADYTAVQYARASVTLLTEGTELLPLCTSVGTAVIIENLTTKSVLFSGYVTQNTFTQQLITDTLTVECVDKLGYSMHKPVPDISLIQCSTLAGWCAAFGDILGVKNVYLSTAVTLRRRSDGKETPRYYRMTFPGRYFLKDVMPDIINGKANYAKQKMTIFEALTMIAESLRMTFVQVGESLYLEEPGVTSDIRSYINAATYVQHDIVLPVTALTEESFGGTDNSVTTLPIYTYFSIMHDKLEERTVCLPVFDDKYLKPLNQKNTYSKGDETVVVYKMQSLVSAVNSDDYSGAEWVSWKKLKKDDEASGTQRGTECAYDSTFTKAVRIWTINGLKKNLIVVPIVPGISVSPGWGRGLKIKANITITDDINLPFPDVEIDDAFPLIWVRLRVGNSYYDGKAWTSEEVVFGMRVRKDGTTYIAEYSSDNRDYISYEGLQTDGLTDVEIGIALNAYGKVGEYRVGYLTELDVVEVLMPDVANTESLWHSPAREETGEYDASREYGEVTLPIDLYYLSSEKTFGTNIGGTDYADGTETAGAELRFGSSKMSMIEKIQAVATRGGGTQYDLTLRDDHNNIRLQQKYQASFFEGEKSVVAYEKNLLDNTTKITII